MTRRQKDPLRELTDDERDWLWRIARLHAQPAAHVARAKALLAVAEGASYVEAAKAAGRRSNDALSNLVSRFNREGLAAIEPRHGGGPPIVYAEAERERFTWRQRSLHEEADKEKNDHHGEMAMLVTNASVTQKPSCGTLDCCYEHEYQVLYKRVLSGGNPIVLSVSISDLT